MSPPRKPRRLFTFFITASLALLLRRAAADCECGYTTTTNASTSLFTDLLESDFLHLSDIATNTDWRRQVFNVSATDAHGPYGQAAQLRNVVSNPLANRTGPTTGPGVHGGDAGLQLFVRGGVPKDGLVKGAEVDSAREDMRWGSYRAGLKLSGVPGTCAAFFWYFNDTQEIDIEFLSSHFNFAMHSFPIHLVIQSPPLYPPSHTIIPLPFDPTAAFHEFRIDLLPSHIAFYADSALLAILPYAAPGRPPPASPGHVALAHWSNGNSEWSAGPPGGDAGVVVGWVRAYFNSSSSARQRDFEGRCGDPGARGAVCEIPEWEGGEVVLFEERGNMTGNQTVFRESAAGRRGVGGVAVGVGMLGLLLGAW